VILERSLHPCGLVMDYLRSAYTTYMVFRPGDPPVQVRWYFTPPGAKAFPGFHAFASTNWMNRNSDVGDLGEQPGVKPWVNGASFQPVVGTNLSASCMNLNWFRNGLGPSDVSGPYDAQGVPICCTPVPPIPTTPCGGCSIPLSLKVTCYSDLNPCLNGLVIPLEWNAFFGRWDNGPFESIDCGDCVTQATLFCDLPAPGFWFLVIGWGDGVFGAWCTAMGGPVEQDDCLPIFFPAPVSVNPEPCLFSVCRVGFVNDLNAVAIVTRREA